MGADVNEQGRIPEFNLKLTALCQAARQGSGDIVQVLINNGADLEAMDNFW